MKNMNHNNLVSNTSEEYIQYILKTISEKHFNKSDIIAYMGGIDDRVSIPLWKRSIEKNGITANERGITSLVILLSTHGGSVNAVEKMVEITRYFYEEIYFVIYSEAMSAGTVWAMSGDKIYMSYASSLGPIDPQVPDEAGRYIPALGTLDKVNEIINRSSNGLVTQAELMQLQKISLGMIRFYEQARDLSIALLQKWLVKYKFKDWNIHESKRTPVTEEDKKNRAKEIAESLSDNNIWHSHGRYIGIETLQDTLNLKIDDFSKNSDMISKCDIVDNLLKELMIINQQMVLVVSGSPQSKITQNKE